MTEDYPPPPKRPTQQPVGLPQLQVDEGQHQYTRNQLMRLSIMTDCYNCHKYEPMCTDELLLMEPNHWHYSEQLEKLRFLLIDRIRENEHLRIQLEAELKWRRDNDNE